MTQQAPIPPADSSNPFFQDRTGAFGVPPFADIQPEHFPGAYDRAFAEHDAEIAAIAGDPAAPSFDNTIVALELAGRTLDRIGSVFGVLAGAHTNDALLAVEREISPRRARHWNGILLNQRLAALGTAFSQNLLADEQGYTLVLESEEGLAGLPDFVRQAARAAATE